MGSRPWEHPVESVVQLALGDEVWLSPAGADDEPIVAVCVPAEDPPSS